MIGTAYGQSAKSRYSVATLADLEDRIPQTPNETIEVRNGSSTNLWAAPRLFVLTNSIEAADRVYVVTNRTASTRYIATDRSTGIIDPRHFGATPDDLYDDSTALQAAIDAAGTRSSVYLPKGRFLLASPLAYKDQLHVKGEGDGTMLAVSTPNGIAFWNATPGTRLYEVFLENFAINTAIGARGSAAITLTNVSYARLEKITVHAYDGKGFQYGVKTWGDSPASVGGAWSSSMVGCRIYVYAWPGQPAYAFYGSGGPEWGHGPNSWRIYDNYLNCQPDWVFGGGGTNNGTAILFAQNQNGIQLSKNIFEGWYTNSIILDTGAASTIDGNRFEVSYGIGGTNFAAIRLVNMTNVFIGANMSQGLGDMTKYIRSVNSSYTLFDAASGSPNTIDGDVIVGKTWDVDNVGYLPTVDRFLLMDSTLPTTSLGMGLRTIDGTNNPRSIMVLHAFPGTNISGVNTSWAGIFHGSTLGTVPFYFHASQTNLAITGAGTAVLGLPISSAEFTTYGDIVAGPAPSLWVGSIPSGPVLSITGDGTNQTPNFVVGIQEPPGYPVTNNLRMSGGARGPSNRTYIQSTSSSISPPLDVMIGGTTGAVFTASGASIMGHPVGSAELTVVGDLVAGPNPRMPFALSPADRDIAIYSDSVLDSLGLTAGVFDGVNNPRFSFTYLGPSVRSQINSSGALTNPPIDFMVGSTTGAVLTASGLSVLGHRVSGAALTVFGDIYAGPQPNAWAGSKAGSGNLTITATDTNAMPSIVLGHQGGANSRVEMVTSNLLAKLVATSSAGAIALEMWSGSQRVAQFDATDGLVIDTGLPFSIGGESFTDISGTNLIVAGNKLNVYGLAAQGHTHDASNTVSGQFAAERLGTGTATTNTFLQGNGASAPFWGTIPSVASPTNGIADAPADGIFYGRRNNSWTQPDVSDLSGVSGWGLAWIDGTVVDDVDALTTLGLLGGGPTTIDSPAKYAVRVGSGGTVSTRHRLNMIASTGLTLAISDDAINDESDVTVSIADRDWGDITSTSGGTQWEIDDNAVDSDKIVANSVTYAKIQNVVASRVLGRGAGAGDGDPEELTIGPGLAMTGAAIHTNPVVVAASKLIGRGSAAGSGAAEEITVGPGLTMTGTTLDVTPPSSGFSTVLGNTDAVTVPDTESAETTLIGTIRSGESATFGAGTLATGTIVKVEAMGAISAAGNWADGVLRVKFGSSRALAFTVLEPDSYTATDYAWRLTAYLSVTTAGASATTVFSGLLEYEYPNDADTPGVRRLRHLSGTASGTLDTTGSNAFDVTWDNATGLEVDWTCNHLLVTRY